MKEILFKAKRLKTDEFDESGWVLGLPQYDADGKITSIQSQYTGKENILPETICQYTGLTDSNGVKIFENDFIQLMPNSDTRFLIKWNSEDCCFVVNSVGSDRNFQLSDLLAKESVVVGNRFNEV